jgi:hypothetical protein
LSRLHSLDQRALDFELDFFSFGFRTFDEAFSNLFPFIRYKVAALAYANIWPPSRTGAIVEMTLQLACNFAGVDRCSI